MWAFTPAEWGVCVHPGVLATCLNLPPRWHDAAKANLMLINHITHRHTWTTSRCLSLLKRLGTTDTVYMFILHALISSCISWLKALWNFQEILTFILISLKWSLHNFTVFSFNCVLYGLSWGHSCTRGRHMCRCTAECALISQQQHQVYAPDAVNIYAVHFPSIF